MKKVIIMRGIPGSGKSTYVKEHFSEALVCSADNYFEELAALNNTSYLEEFNRALVPMAHAFCRDSFNHATEVMDEPLVVVDNTNIRNWEYQFDYAESALRRGYEVHIVEIPFSRDMAEEYHRRNKHGVPLEVIKGMMDAYEPSENALIFSN